jgi:hypothetical protein
MMRPNHEAIVGAIAWLSTDCAVPPLMLCPIQRLRYWAASTERCDEDSLRSDLEYVITAGFVRWYMPGVLTLTAAGARVGRAVLKRCGA